MRLVRHDYLLGFSLHLRDDHLRAGRCALLHALGTGAGQVLGWWANAVNRAWGRLTKRWKLAFSRSLREGFQTGEILTCAIP